MTWAAAQTTGSPARKAVLLVLADTADAHGVAYPAVRHLVEVTELGERTVRRALADLEEAGLVRRHERRRASGRQRSSIYVLAPTDDDRGQMRPVAESDGYSTWADAQPPAIAAGGQTAAPAPRQTAAPAGEGCQSGTPVSTEPSQEPSLSSSSGARDGAQIDEPSCWPAARAALIDAGFDAAEVDRSRGALIRRYLADERRPIDWPALGAQLRRDRADGESMSTKPLQALGYGLRQDRPPVIGGQAQDADEPRRGRPRRRPGRPGRPTAAVLAAPDAAATEAWQRVAADAAARIADPAEATWLQQLHAVAVGADGTLTIGAPPTNADWLRRRLGPLLAASATRCGLTDAQLVAGIAATPTQHAA